MKGVAPLANAFEDACRTDFWRDVYYTFTFTFGGDLDSFVECNILFSNICVVLNWLRVRGHLIFFQVFYLYIFSVWGMGGLYPRFLSNYPNR